MKSGPTLEQWNLVYRLRAAGCPIDLGRLRPPSHPLEVVNRPSTLTSADGRLNGSNVWVLEGRTWLVLRLEIQVVSEVRIEGVRVRADWLGGEASLVDRCGEHEMSYCLALKPGGGHLEFYSWSVLNRLSRPGTVLRRGEHMSGLILAVGAGFPASEAPQYLDAEVCFDDWKGNEMRFPVVVVNRLSSFRK